jgi:hypothetical protein
VSKIEVFLDQNQIQNLKSILNQSEVGIHLLFDRELITSAFQNETPESDFFEVDHLKKTQDDLIKLLQFQQLSEKKNFISSLSAERQHSIVRAYFYIIENNLKQSQKLQH